MYIIDRFVIKRLCFLSNTNQSLTFRRKSPRSPILQPQLSHVTHFILFTRTQIIMMSASYNCHQKLAYLNDYRYACALDEQNHTKKKRSHRPRGCRGGGSRRARKAAREMQRSDEMIQPQFLGKIRAQSKLYCIHEGMPSLATVSYSGSDDESIIPLVVQTGEPTTHQRILQLDFDILPTFCKMQNNIPTDDESPLQFGTQAALTKTHRVCAELAFDVVPALPVLQKYETFEMNTALPPLPSTADSLEVSSCSILRFPKNSRKAEQTSTVQYNNLIDQPPEHPIGSSEVCAESFHSNDQVASQTYLDEIVVDYLYLDGGNAGNQNPIAHPYSFQQNERIEKQRQVLAGGSLFLTSPRSFLMGSQKTTSSSIF